MDRHEFESLAQRLRPRVVAIACKVLADSDTAEDVAQETLLKMWSLRERLPEYRSIDGLAMVIARNRCLDILRREGRSRSVAIEEFDTVSADLAPDEVMIDAESDSEASQILAMLPEGQQMVLKMKHIEGLEVEEIAALTGSTPNAIRVTLSRARKRVRDIFNNRREL